MKAACDQHLQAQWPKPAYPCWNAHIFSFAYSHRCLQGPKLWWSHLVAAQSLWFQKEAPLRGTLNLDLVADLTLHRGQSQHQGMLQRWRPRWTRQAPREWCNGDADASRGGAHGLITTSHNLGPYMMISDKNELKWILKWSYFLVYLIQDQIWNGNKIWMLEKKW